MDKFNKIKNVYRDVYLKLFMLSSRNKATIFLTIGTIFFEGFSLVSILMISFILIIGRILINRKNKNLDKFGEKELLKKIKEIVKESEGENKQYIPLGIATLLFLIFFLLAKGISIIPLFFIIIGTSIFFAIEHIIATGNLKRIKEDYKEYIV